MDHITFDHDGVTYTLRYDFNALCRAEERADLPISEIMERLAASKLTMLRVMFWAGLSPQRSLDDAGALIYNLGIDKVNDLITRAVSASKFLSADASDDAPKKTTAQGG